ncbi:FHA domain-containing protein [bacterium]|nr:FHA domain-containing protein [bacterium]
MIALKIIKGPSHKGQSYPLEVGQTKLLGRSQGCDIRLNSKDISKRHFRLTVLPGGKAEVEDLGSANGTFINGVLIKKHMVRAGDYIGVSNYIIQLGVEAPDVDTSAGFATDFESTEQAGGTKLQQDPRNKAKKWINENIGPWADKLGIKYDLRILVISSLLIWVSAVIISTVIPLVSTANTAIEAESIESAKLYARQLARLNQQAILEQRYRDLIEKIDERPGQTPGVYESYILDAQKAIILAPASQAGNNLPSRFAVEAIQQNQTHVSKGFDGTAYVSVPIKVGINEGGRVETRVEAVAFVVFDTQYGVFGFPQILNQIVNSLLVALVTLVIVLIFINSWIDGSLDKLHARIQSAIKNSETYLAPVDIKWNKLNEVINDASSLLGRIGAGSGVESTAPGTGASWADATAGMNIIPSAAFDEQLIVTAWNPLMESLMGIRAHIAIGNDISGASRDLAFESTVRALADESLATEWRAVTKTFEVSGENFLMSMIYGGRNFYLAIKALEEDD